MVAEAMRLDEFVERVTDQLYMAGSALGSEWATWQRIITEELHREPTKQENTFILRKLIMGARR